MSRRATLEQSLASASEPDHGSDPAAKQRPNNVFDAVAGRITGRKDTVTGMNVSRRAAQQRENAAAAQDSNDNNNNNNNSSSNPNPNPYRAASPAPFAPEEVLFRRKGAPMRYAEKDIYFAHEDLPHEGRGLLPHSDMVKAVHGYASHFYEAMAQRRRGQGRDAVGTRLLDERSMDETALLAFGILLEEASREALGRRGDLVFTEGMAEGQDPDLHLDLEQEQGDAVVSGARPAEALRAVSKQEAQMGGNADTDEEGRKGRRHKRRKMA